MTLLNKLNVELDLFHMLSMFWAINSLHADFFQTVWIQIRPNILLGLNWVKTVRKDIQMTLAGKELRCESGDFFLFLGLRILRPKFKFLHFRKKLKFYFGLFLFSPM